MSTTIRRGGRVIFRSDPGPKKEERERTHNEQIRDQVEELIETQKDLLNRKKQVLRMESALEFVKVTWDKVQALDRRDNMVVGVWLIQRDYATKQKGEPSDYRRFEKPVYYSPNGAVARTALTQTTDQ